MLRPNPEPAPSHTSDPILMLLTQVFRTRCLRTTCLCQTFFFFFLNLFHFTLTLSLVVCRLPPSPVRLAELVTGAAWSRLAAHTSRSVASKRAEGGGGQTLTRPDAVGMFAAATWTCCLDKK